MSIWPTSKRENNRYRTVCPGQRKRVGALENHVFPQPDMVDCYVFRKEKVAPLSCAVGFSRPRCRFCGAAAGFAAVLCIYRRFRRPVDCRRYRADICRLLLALALSFHVYKRAKPRRACRPIVIGGGRRAFDCLYLFHLFPAPPAAVFRPQDRNLRDRAEAGEKRGSARSFSLFVTCLRKCA